MSSDLFDESVAAHYEGWYRTPEGQRADRLEKGLLEWLLERFQEAASVLEVGCGTGHFSRWLSARGLRVVGLDRSGPMLAQARMLDGVSLVRGDGHRLPFADGSFDIAVLVTTLEFLEQPREALKEALRVARRGLILGVLNRWSLLGVARRLAGLRRRTIYNAAPFYGVGELKRLLRSVAGKKAHIRWRTTLFPRGYLWERSRLPWGGFVGMAVILERKE